VPIKSSEINETLDKLAGEKLIWKIKLIGLKLNL
jgi:hypothetical protein